MFTGKFYGNLENCENAKFRTANLSTYMYGSYVE